MTSDDKQAFAAQMAWLAEVFGERMSPVRMSGYFQALIEFSIEDVRLASAAVIQREKFFPKPAELIESARHFKGLRMRALRAEQQPVLPAAPASAEDRCPLCGRTVGEHQQEFRELVATIGTEAHVTGVR